MRVVVADDVMVTREGIAHVLTEAGAEVVGRAADAKELLSCVAAERPDIAIVDIRMPPTHTDEGLVAARQIRADFDHVGVLVLSQFVDIQYAMQLLQDYPERSGYLLKERVLDGAVLMDALHRIGEGETVLDPSIVARLLDRRRRDNPLLDLTAREREILGLMAEGLSNRAIAQRQSISERTVEAHVTQIFTKLRLDDSSNSNRRVLAVVAFLRE